VRVFLPAQWSAAQTEQSFIIKKFSENGHWQAPEAFSQQIHPVTVTEPAWRPEGLLSQPLN